MQKLFASLSLLALAGCAAAVSPTAPATEAAPMPPPWVIVKKLVPLKQPALRKAPVRDDSRLPLPGDIDFAWDKLNHRGQVRWECRATPSGQFVRQSFCARLLKLDGPRPASFSDLTGWTGMIYAD